MLGMNLISSQNDRVACTLQQVINDEKDDVVTKENLDEIWRRIRAALTRALDPYPEVRMIVLRELEVEFAAQPKG